jgi:hypothetical protein
MWSSLVGRELARFGLNCPDGSAWRVPLGQITQSD